jgi:hypothetical protein
LKLSVGTKFSTGTSAVAKIKITQCKNYGKEPSP